MDFYVGEEIEARRYQRLYISAPVVKGRSDTHTIDKGARGIIVRVIVDSAFSSSIRLRIEFDGVECTLYSAEAEFDYRFARVSALKLLAEIPDEESD